MTVKELAEVLVQAHKIVEEEWNKRTPEQRRKICENILKKSGKFAKSKEDSNQQIKKGTPE